MNVAVDTLTDEVEPYLLRRHFIVRTPRGRRATAAAYRHLGLPEPAPRPEFDLDRPAAAVRVSASRVAWLTRTRRSRSQAILSGRRPRRSRDRVRGLRQSRSGGGTTTIMRRGPARRSSWSIAYRSRAAASGVGRSIRRGRSAGQGRRVAGPARGSTAPTRPGQAEADARSLGPARRDRRASGRVVDRHLAGAASERSTPASRRDLVRRMASRRSSARSLGRGSGPGRRMRGGRGRQVEDRRFEADGRSARCRGSGRSGRRGPRGRARPGSARSPSIGWRSGRRRAGPAAISARATVELGDADADGRRGPR